MKWLGHSLVRWQWPRTRLLRVLGWLVDKIIVDVANSKKKTIENFSLEIVRVSRYDMSDQTNGNVSLR